MKNTDFLFDLLQELDKRYQSIHVTHAGVTTYMNVLGPYGCEMVADIIDTAGKVTLRMHTPLPEAYSVALNLQERDDSDLWDVRLEAGGKNDELFVSDILGKLKEFYS